MSQMMSKITRIVHNIVFLLFQTNRIPELSEQLTGEQCLCHFQSEDGDLRCADSIQIQPIIHNRTRSRRIAHEQRTIRALKCVNFGSVKDGLCEFDSALILDSKLELRRFLSSLDEEKNISCEDEVEGQACHWVPTGNKASM